MIKECWAWDFRTQRHIEVPGWNINVECRACGNKFVTAEDTERGCWGGPIV